MAQSFEIGPFHFQTRPLCRVFYLDQAMTDRQQIDAEMNGCIDALKVTSPCVTPERMDGWVLKSPEQLACASEEDSEMERDIQALGLTAPRVTPDQIDALMHSVRYEVQVVPGTTTTLATAIAANRASPSPSA